MAAAPLEQTFWETFCDLIGLAPELHDDEKSSTATKARVTAIIATEKFHGVPRWSLGIISCRCKYLESGTKAARGPRSCRYRMSYCRCRRSKCGDASEPRKSLRSSLWKHRSPGSKRSIRQSTQSRQQISRTRVSSR